MASYKLQFTGNALSKWSFLRAVFRIVSFRSKGDYRRSKELLANYFDRSPEQIFLFGAGRMSVYNLLKSINVKADDEVIVAGYTCVVLTNAVKFAGCKVRYVDIDINSLNLDTSAVINAVSDKTKAIIVPHNFGIPYEDIQKLKSQFPNVIIIEDVAHTFGSEAGSMKCGTIGDAGFFSLEYSKPLSSGLGGLMIINNKDLLENFDKSYRTLSFMSFGMAFKIYLTFRAYVLLASKRTMFWQQKALAVLSKLNLIYRTSEKEVQGELPENYPVKLRPFLATFLYVQLQNIDRINEQKREIVQRLDKAFLDFEDIVHYPLRNNVLVRYPIVFKERVPTDKVQKIIQDGFAKGYNFGVWFNDVVHPQGSFRYCYNENSCATGEFVANHIVNLPVNISYPLSDQHLEEIKMIFRDNGIK